MSIAQFPIAERTPNASTGWYATEPWVQFGLRTIVYTCTGLFAASMLLPISGAAVVTTGTVVVESDDKTVQAPERGIVSKMLVQNGDRVNLGDVLLQFNGAQPHEDIQATDAKFAEFAIHEARLIAERDLKDKFDSPASVDLTSPDNVKILDQQKALFETRRNAYLGEINGLNQRVTQTESELTAATAQLELRGKELALNELEMSNVPLFDKSFSTTQRLGPLQRDNVRIRSDLINLKAQIAKLKTSRTEIDARLTQVGNDYKHRAAEELPKIQAALAEQTDQLKAISDKQTRTEIRAPASGAIQAIAVQSDGSEVQPGSTLLQIIPDERKVLIDAEIEPKDIDNIAVGQTASLRFSSTEGHMALRLDGVVRKISNSAITGTAGKSYYPAQIEVPSAEISKRDASQRPVPGMQAEVYLETQSRSALFHFLSPLTSMLTKR